MGEFTGDYSRNTLKAGREKQYKTELHQQGRPVADSDLNEGNGLVLEAVRTFIDNFAGSVIFKSTSFLVDTSSNDNSFKVTKGSLWLDGRECYLENDVDFMNTGDSVSDLNIFSVATDVSGSVLTDSSMKWNENELVGRDLVVDIASGLSFPIVSNTNNSVTVSGVDLTLHTSVLNPYRINLSEPSVPRTDSVWVNYYEDEIDSEEDSSLIHGVGSGIELSRRLKGRTIIMVQEGASDYTNYTDSDGNDHILVKIAELNRTASPSISNITDLRSITMSGSALEEIISPYSDTGKVFAVNTDITKGFVDDKVVAVSPLVKSVLDPTGNAKVSISIQSPNNGDLYLRGTDPLEWAQPDVALAIEAEPFHSAVSYPQGDSALISYVWPSTAKFLRIICEGEQNPDSQGYGSWILRCSDGRIAGSFACRGHIGNIYRQASTGTSYQAVSSGYELLSCQPNNPAEKIYISSVSTGSRTLVIRINALSTNGGAWQCQVWPLM